MANTDGQHDGSHCLLSMLHVYRGPSSVKFSGVADVIAGVD